MQVPICRPRVFLTDFEYAFEFPSDTSPSERLLTGLPVPDYRPRVAPEVTSGRPYDPFKADVWQLAYYFSNFDVSVLISRVDHNMHSGCCIYTVDDHGDP